MKDDLQLLSSAANQLQVGSLRPSMLRLMLSIPAHHLVVLAHFDRHVGPLAPLNASSVVAVSSDVARHRVQCTVLAHRLQDVGSWEEVLVGREVHSNGATEHVNGQRNLFARVAPGASGITEVHLNKSVDWKCV